MPEPQEQLTSIVTDAKALSITARSLASLVKMASPELTFETYVTLRSKIGSERLIASTSCGVLTAQVSVGRCQAESPLPTAEIVSTSQFLGSVGAGSENQKIALTIAPGTGRIKYKRGTLHGDVDAVDPSSVIRTNISTNGKKFMLPTQLVRSALEATSFATVDPNAKEVGGVISRITTKNGELECVSYDSLCGALFKGKSPEIQEGIDFVLPNQMLHTLLSFTNEPFFYLTIDQGTSLEFRTKSAIISMTLREYPNINVAGMIKKMSAEADEGIVVDPKKVIDTVESIISIGAADKEIINLNVTQGATSVRFMIKSESINCAEVVQCTSRFKKRMDIIVDTRRFLNFIKPCKKEDSVEVRHGSGRVIIQAPSALFAFSVS